MAAVGDHLGSRLLLADTPKQPSVARGRDGRHEYGTRCLSHEDRHFISQILMCRLGVTPVKHAERQEALRIFRANWEQKCPEKKW